MQINLEKIQEAQAELAKLEELKKLMGGDAQELPFVVGKKYFIRTVTYHAVIEIKRIVGQFIEGKYAWIADSGRFMDAIDKGELNEVEPVSVDGGININSITDYFEWNYEIPTKQQ